ncbi:MAG TPA: geranylgeranyl reductase family protein, partial [Gaiellaceae bacterium]|nr:geranylgeranyl reductase family protein [Gaiellaceae bacterium]
MERFDAIVVGAGPAGSTTAYRLARAGSNVLLLDRARFPRDKPCGGGLTIRAVRQMPVPPDPVVEHVVDRMGFRLDYRSRFERGGREPLILMTQRRRLDHYLVEQAAAAGATVRDGVKVADVTVGERAVRVAVDGAPVEAAALVAADGANGTTRRALDLGGEYVLGVALEGNAARGVVGDRYDGLAEFELGTIPGGYGWIFPKGDHVNVGVGGWQYLAGTLRARLSRLCRFYGVPEERMEGLRGHQLPVRRHGAPLARGRVALVGDAAGLVDPLSGEGIYAAIYSGGEAARAAAELLAGERHSLSPYAARIERELMPDLDASRRFQDVFYLVPGLYVGLLERSDRIWSLLARLI